MSCAVCNERPGQPLCPRCAKSLRARQDSPEGSYTIALIIEWAAERARYFERRRRRRQGWILRKLPRKAA